MEDLLYELVIKFEKKIDQSFLDNNIMEYDIISGLLNVDPPFPPEINDYIYSIKKKKYKLDDIFFKLKKFRLYSIEKRKDWIKNVKKSALSLSKIYEGNFSNEIEEYNQIKKIIEMQLSPVDSKGILITFVNLANIEYELREKSINLLNQLDWPQSKFFLKELLYEVAAKRKIVNIRTSAEKELDDLKTALGISKQEIESLKEEIEEIREGQKIDSIISFLRDLNSSQNGNLLDQFSISAETIKRLKKEKFEFPSQLASIPTNIRMFMKFINNLGVKPISQIGDQFKVNLESSQDYNYLGTPFSDSEEKLVEVLTPGWKFEEQIISKPQVKEIINEETKEG